MSISATLQDYLDQHDIQYELIPHRYTETSLRAANVAHVPAENIAKSVILEDEQGYLMAVIPADHRVRLGAVNKLLGRNVCLATEREIQPFFQDCETGAIPPVGQAYGMETIVDDCLNDCPELYLEAGDHEDFIHLDGMAYQQLMATVPHAKISM